MLMSYVILGLAPFLGLDTNADAVKIRQDDACRKLLLSEVLFLQGEKVKALYHALNVNETVYRLGTELEKGISRKRVGGLNCYYDQVGKGYRCSLDENADARAIYHALNVKVEFGSVDVFKSKTGIITTHIVVNVKKVPGVIECYQTTNYDVVRDEEGDVELDEADQEYSCFLK